MTKSVQSLQAVQSKTQTEQTVQPPKTLQEQAAKQDAVPQDQVTISQEAREALANDDR